MKNIFTLMLIFLLVNCAENFSSVNTPNVDYVWSEIEPLGGYFTLNIENFKNNKFSAYVYSPLLNKKYIFNEFFVDEKYVEKTIYVEINFHYEKNLELYIFKNGNLFTFMKCNPQN
jgi:hypothetical protein